VAATPGRSREIGERTARRHKVREDADMSIECAYAGRKRPGLDLIAARHAGL
jgi:hypothetical protein